MAIIKRRCSKTNHIAALSDQIQYFDNEDGIDKPSKAFHRFDAVVHTATCYGRRGESVTEIFEANTAFPRRLLEAATFVNTDTTLHSDLNAYSLSKNYFAEWEKTYGESGKIRFLNICPEHMSGPGDEASKFTTHVIRSCLANVPDIKLTPGHQKRDFIHIDDVVSAYTLLLEKHQALDRSFLSFGLGSGDPVSIREFAELVQHLTHSRTELKFGALPYREGEILESAADIGALRALGWRPGLDLSEGLHKTIRQEERDSA